MAKRFISTDIWDEDWFIDLPVDYMMFWFWITTKCDHAGFWKPNLNGFKRTTKKNISLTKALEYFNTEKIRILVLVNNHWFIKGFVPFQYGANLNANNHLHKSVRNLLTINNISPTTFDLNLTSSSPQVDLNLTSSSGVRTPKDKDKEKDILSSNFSSILKTNIPEKISGEDFLNNILDRFCKVYLEKREIDFIVTNKGKQRTACRKIYEVILKRNENTKSYIASENKTEFMLNKLELFFKYCLDFDDDFLQKSMSPAIIEIKINEILQNAKKTKTSMSKTITEIMKEREELERVRNQ
jgi:hypothetical protein